MNLPGFNAKASLQEAGHTYCCFAYHGAGSLTPVVVPQLYRADPDGCGVVCDSSGNCALDCPWPGVSFGPGGLSPNKSPRIKCVKRCIRKYSPGSAAYEACVDKCPY